MLGKLHFSSSKMIVVWKSLDNAEEVGVLDFPEAPLLQLGSPVLDTYHPEVDLESESDYKDSFLVLCLTPIGLGYVDSNHVK